MQWGKNECRAGRVKNKNAPQNVRYKPNENGKAWFLSATAGGGIYFWRHQF